MGPRVSVLLPVWNGEAFLEAAVESILRQTLFWSAHHGLILPSRCEGLPIALVEAMLSGRVPVVTDVGGNAEVVDDGVTGYIAAAPTEDALDDAMERAWNERHRWREIGAAAAARIRTLVPREPERCFAKRLVEAVSRT